MLLTQTFTHLYSVASPPQTKLKTPFPSPPNSYLSEYLIVQSLLREGRTDETGVLEEFIYEEHGMTAKRPKPRATTMVVQSVDAELERGRAIA